MSGTLEVGWNEAHALSRRENSLDIVLDKSDDVV